MTERWFILRAGFWIFILKVFALFFVGGMFFIQIPNLLYNLGSTAPVTVSGPEDLTRDRFSSGAVFVSIQGKPDFSRAFVYRRYGLDYTYFNLQPYGMKLVVRTHQHVTDDWKSIRQFLGKLRPFDGQPFSYRIREIYQEKFNEDIPEDAFFMSHEEIPQTNGWIIGAPVFAVVLWLTLFYLFFIRPRRKSRSNNNQIHPSGDPPQHHGS